MKPLWTLGVLLVLLLAAGAAQGALTGVGVRDDFYTSNLTLTTATGNVTSAGDNATGLVSSGFNDTGLNITFKESGGVNSRFKNVTIQFPNNWTLPLGRNYTNTTVLKGFAAIGNNTSCQTVWVSYDNLTNTTVGLGVNTVNVTFGVFPGVASGGYDVGCDASAGMFINFTEIGISNPAADNLKASYDAPIKVCTNVSSGNNCVTTHIRVMPGPVVGLVDTMPVGKYYNATTGNDPSNSNNFSFNITVRDRPPSAVATVGFTGVNATNVQTPFTTMVAGSANATPVLGTNYVITFPIANWGSSSGQAATQAEILGSDGNWTIFFNVSDNANPPRWNNLTSVANVAIDRTAPVVSGFNLSGCGDFTNGLYQFTVADTTGQNFSDNATGASWVSLKEDSSPTAEACDIQGFAAAPGLDVGSAPYTVTCRRGAAMAQGPHTVTAQAFDKAGNPSNNISATFEYRTAAGALTGFTMTSAAEVSTESHTATGTQDPTGTPGGATWSIPVTLACGANTITVGQTKAGECSSSASFTVTRICGYYIAPTTGGGRPTPTPAPTPVVETQAVISISPFTPTTLTFSQTAVQAVTIETKAPAVSVSVTVTQHLALPSGFTAPPAAAASAVNRYISVDAKNLYMDDLARATLKFTVERTWLTQNNVSEGQVALARHDDKTKEWQTFAGKLVKEEGGVLTYESTVPRLSLFAIVAAEPAASPAPSLVFPPSVATPPPAPTGTVAPPPAGATPTPTLPPGTRASPVPPAKSPGFEAWVALGALGVALVLARGDRKN